MLADQDASDGEKHRSCFDLLFDLPKAMKLSCLDEAKATVQALRLYNR